MSTVIKIKGPEKSIVEYLLEKISKLEVQGYRIIQGFVQKEKDDTGYVVFINVTREEKDDRRN